VADNLTKHSISTSCGCCWPPRFRPASPLRRALVAADVQRHCSRRAALNRRPATAQARLEARPRPARTAPTTKKSNLLSGAMLSLVWLSASASAHPACVPKNGAAQQGANTTDAAAPLYIDMTGLSLATRPPTTRWRPSPWPGCTLSSITSCSPTRQPPPISSSGIAKRF